MARDPFKHYAPLPRHTSPTMALANNLKHPYIGVTQGGSSRKNAGAAPAATRTLLQRSDATDPAQADAADYGE